MGKNIYGLLNEVETDFSEYEELELSSQELEQHKHRIMMEVKSMGNKFEANMDYENRNTKRKGKVWMKAAGIAAACAIAVGGVSVANPVLAKELFSSVFGKLVQNAQGEKYEQEDTEMFTKIGENAIAVQSEVESRQSEGQAEESYMTSVENQGVTVSVSDVYCDGYVLYFTTELKTDQEGLNRADGIMAEGTNARIPNIAIDGIVQAGYTSRSFEKSDDGTFVTVNQINLLDPYGSDEQPVDLGIDGKDTMVIDWTVNNFIGNLYDEWDDQGEYMQTGSVEGEWHLRFPVTIDRSANEIFEINKEENGIIVKRGIKTKAGLLLEVEMPDFRQAPYNDPYNDPDVAIRDSEGNILQWMDQKANIHEDGTSVEQIMVLYDGQKDLSLEVTTKDEEPVTLANIAFQVP